MEWEIPIYEQGMLRGQLRAERQGLRTVFRADCPAWDEGIRKVWLRGGRGNLLLGTLVPEGDRLRLGRTISNAMLREKGLEYCQRAEIEGAMGQPAPQKQSRPAQESRWLPVARLSLPGMDRMGFVSVVPGRSDSGCPACPSSALRPTPPGGAGC